MSDIVINYRVTKYYNVVINVDRLAAWCRKKYGTELDLDTDEQEFRELAMKYAQALKPMPYDSDDPELLEE